MAKLTLTNIVATGGETTKVLAINNNSNAIEAAIENTLSRDGTSPNEMQANLDMNSNRILNLAEPVSATEPVRKQEFDALVLSGGGGGGTATWGDIVGTIGDQADLTSALAAKQTSSAALTSVAGISSDGFVAHTASNTYASRTFVAPGAGFTITNPSGIAGNPTFALSDDLNAIEALSSTGIVRRTALNTWTAGTLITNSELANMPSLTIKGNDTLSAAAPLDLSVTQITAILDIAVGSNGISAGTKGLVPAPGIADNVKFLRGDMTYVTIPGGGDALTSSSLSQFASTTSAEMRALMSDESGTGALLFQSGDLGTPTAGVLTNCTGLPYTSITGFTSGPTVQVFTADGTWTRPSGCKRIRVRVLGGGGGGAGATAASSQCCAGTGGGSGAYSEGIFDVTSTSSAAVTVGAGGAGGAAANGTGSTGGTSAFGSLITGVNGGPGGNGLASGTGVAISYAATPAAAGTGGFMNLGGNAGDESRRDSGTLCVSGSGAPSIFGGGPRAVVFAGIGAAGNAPGAGGSGALSTSTTGYVGGAGAAGIVIVEEFY